MTSEKEEYKQILRKNLQFYRKKTELTQAQLSELIGMHNVSIARFENGDRTPSVKLLFKIAKALNIEASKLLEK